MIATITILGSKAAPVTSKDVRRERLARRLEAAVLKCRNSDTPKNDDQKKVDEIRSAAQARYQSAVDDFTAHAKANALAKKKKKREELIALFLLLMLDAGEESYSKAYPELEALQPETKTGSALEPEKVQSQAEEFSESRQENLKQFPARIIDRFEEITNEVEESKTSEKEIRSILNKAAAAVKSGEGKVMAEAEAQGVYGSAQIRILKRVGFKTAIWNQLERPTKRDTHALNMELGEKPLGYLYPNGQRYPGDPKGGPGENCNCLCYLEGVRR